MSDKKVPMMVGDICIGRASVETTAEGTKIVNVSIDNPDWGSWSIAGFVPLRLVGVLPPNFKKEEFQMAAAEDRQAKALESLDHSVKQLVKIMATFNENTVKAFNFLQEKFEQAVAVEENQMSIDDLRAQAEKEHADREQRAVFEDSSRHGSE